MNNKKIAFIGGGNMAGSIINGLLNAGYNASQICVSTPHAEKVEALKQKFGICGTTSNAKAIEEAEVVVLAVKPQMAAEALAEVTQKGLPRSAKLIISVMAGITVASIQRLLPGTCEIIRVMPNTPALIGYGMAGLYASPKASAQSKEFAEELLNSCGKTVWVPTEDGINDITALSGSAPAYFFRFMECMAASALKMGFSAQDVRSVIEQVALGAANMVIKNQDKTLAELRAAVTSKGGTTYEALRVFEEANLEKIVDDAMEACRLKAEDMSRKF